MFKFITTECDRMLAETLLLTLFFVHPVINLSFNLFAYFHIH